MLIAIALVMDGSVLGALFGAGRNEGGLGLGVALAVGILGAALTVVFAAIRWWRRTQCGSFRSGDEFCASPSP